MTVDVQRILSSLEKVDTNQTLGRVRAAIGLSIRAVMPAVRLSDRVEIDRKTAGPLQGQVVGFSDQDAIVMPLGSSEGVGMGDVVRLCEQPLTIPCSADLLGRVLNGLGEPLDGGKPMVGEGWDVMRKPPDPYTRPRIQTPFVTGLRAIDGFATLGHGQRIGLFAPAGVGKTTLLGQIARHAQADVFVACLIGERGRELREFMEDGLGNRGMRRGVIVCATSDAPALVRIQSAYVATAIAEYFREQGKHVLLLMDSLTRFCRAAREVGLSAGEPPLRRGFPPSAFARLPGLLERCGTSANGSITAFYTVLVEGNDLEEPVSDEVIGLLDGHLVLDRTVAARGRYPAVNVLQSISRLMPQVTTAEHRKLAQAAREHLAHFEAKRDFVLLGAYKTGSDPRLDAALPRIDAIEKFLSQPLKEDASFEQTLELLAQLS